MSGAISVYRRHHISRLKRKWQRTLRAEWPRTGRQLADSQGFVGKMVTTPTRCSGSCCGNPRKWLGHRTMQERRAEIDEDEQLRRG